ncbi:CHAT domain-containing protein [Streptomyces sp. AC555_RSS877]|uniref:CHAT domain-containing protein n=1 Tax=Streptomyces sp. AC555_RSS877 TaxID=2823688 RepID=UPI001C26EC6A|nr:CHAT domain-containing protein [Streptomyces sp. AC555_RSS877]
MATVLELQICPLHPDDCEYEVRVVKAAAGGEPRASMTLDVDELLSHRSELEDKVLASAAATRRVVPMSEQAVQQVGRQLFDALFAGPVSGTYRASLGVARERQERLQIVLRMEAPKLDLLPWEALFDSHDGTYPCRRWPIVRHLPASYTPRPLAVELPLRILVVIASPRGLPMLDTDAERERLEQALAAQVTHEEVELVWVTQASWTSLQSRLLSGRWHVLHFIGHGYYDTLSDEGQIALVSEGGGGGAQMVDASSLADLLGEADPPPRLVVLNSCSSAMGGVDDRFSSVGAALVRGGISAVAAMQFAVSDQASVHFAQGFYTALAHGRRIDDAVRSGRISILGGSKSLEWITPVLYVRGEADSLFDVAASPPRPQVPEPAASHPPHVDPQPSVDLNKRHAQLRTLHAMAGAQLRMGHPGEAIKLLDDLLILDPKDADAAMLRQKAADQQQIVELRHRATEAEESEDWPSAIDIYDQILQKQPEDQDAAGRRNFCRDRRRITHLQEELRIHADAGRWQPVLDVSEEIGRLDPSAADPDRLATRAREAMKEAQRAAQLVRLYAQGLAAEEAGDWSTAIDTYEQILQLDPESRDAATRSEFCRDRRRIAVLREELCRHAGENRWQAVLDVSEEISQLDQDAADPDGLATRARQAVKEAQRATRLDHLYVRALAAEEVEDWSSAIEIYDSLSRDGDGYRDSVRRRDLCIQRRRDGEPAADSRDDSTAPPVWSVELAAPCGALAWNPSWQIIAVNIRSDARIRLYDFSGEEQLDFRTGDKWGPYAVAFSSDGTRLVGNFRQGCKIWDTQTGEKYRQIRFPAGMTSADFSPDGTRLATGLYGYAFVWDVETGKQVFQSRQRAATSVAYSPDGSRLAIADQGGLSVFDTSSGREIGKDHRGFLNAVAFSPDGTYLATASEDCVVRIWDVSARVREACEIAHDYPVGTVDFCPDGNHLAMGGEDQVARVWDIFDAVTVFEMTHEYPVLSVRFSPDGARLATGTLNAVTVWEFQ